MSLFRELIHIYSFLSYYSNYLALHFAWSSLIGPLTHQLSDQSDFRTNFLEVQEFLLSNILSSICIGKCVHFPLKMQQLLICEKLIANTKCNVYLIDKIFIPDQIYNLVANHDSRSRNKLVNLFNFKLQSLMMICTRLLD